MTTSVILAPVLCQTGITHDDTPIPVQVADLSGGFYRITFEYGAHDPDQQASVGVGSGEMSFWNVTSYSVFLNYPGINTLKHIVTYVKGEFITNTDILEVYVREGGLNQRNMKLRLILRYFQVMSYKVEAFGI